MNQNDKVRFQSCWEFVDGLSEKSPGDVDTGKTTLDLSKVQTLYV